MDAGPRRGEDDQKGSNLVIAASSNYGCSELCKRLLVVRLRVCMYLFISSNNLLV